MMPFSNIGQKLNFAVMELEPDLKKTDLNMKNKLKKVIRKKIPRDLKKKLISYKLPFIQAPQALNKESGVLTKG